MSRLDEIKARTEAATEGPWSTEQEVGGAIRVGNEDAWACVTMTTLGSGGEFDNQKADADFVAHAREDVPWLESRLREAIELIGDLAHARAADYLMLAERARLFMVEGEGS